MIRSTIFNFIKGEFSTGILLAVATLLAMVMANTPIQPLYNSLTATPVVISIGEFVIAKPFLLWINGGLMAVFFFLVGLEIKREAIEGSLRS